MQVCCHPFLCDGLEEDIALRRAQALSAAGLDGVAAAQGPQAELELLVRSCGKMVLLHKLLPKVRLFGGGRRLSPTAYLLLQDCGCSSWALPPLPLC